MTQIGMNKHEKVAILGATGLVGSALVRACVERGFSDIIGTHHSTPPSRHASPVDYVKVDLRCQEKVEAFFRQYKPQYVFLAAAKVGGILANNTYKAEFIYDNMAIALNVIHASYMHGVKKLLNLGSSCIYPKFAPQPMKEEHLLTSSLEPTNEPYAIAKIAAIKLVRYYNEQYGTNFISVMPTNLYGPNDNFNLETAHVLPALLRRFHLARLLQEGKLKEIQEDLEKYPIGFGIQNRKFPVEKDIILNILEKIGISSSNNSGKTSDISLTIWGSGEVYREFLYVDDLAAACIYLMENVNAWDLSPTHPLRPTESQSKQELYDCFVNIGTGEDIKIKDLASMIKEITGYEGIVVQDRTKPDGTPKKLLDVSRLKELGWTAKTSLKEGLRKTYEWYTS